MIFTCTLPRFDDNDEPVWDNKDDEPIEAWSNLLPKFDTDDEPYWPEEKEGESNEKSGNTGD